MDQLLHLDWIDYAERLLGNGGIDWSDPAAVSGLLNQAQALLPSDLVILPVGRMLAACAGNALPAARPEGAGPLRALLADPATRATIIDTMRRIDVPMLAIGLPVPGELGRLASTLAGVDAPAVDEDFIDDAAVYTADFLRAFADEKIAGVVLYQTGISPLDATLYAPIERVAGGYGWRFVVAGRDGLPWPALRSERIAPDDAPEAVIARVKRLREELRT